jgi:P27 family predicted phage terminase small subunit
MKGRPPKPTEAKRRAGNPGRRKLPSRADAVSIAPASSTKWTVPKSLGPAGSATWRYLVPMLRRARLLDAADALMLEALCVQVDLAARARQLIAREGTMTKGSTGQRVRHPAVGMLNDAIAMQLRLGEQFGLTPAARARLDVYGSTDPAGEMEDEIGSSRRLRAIQGGKAS